MINVAMEWFNKIKKMFKCEDDYSEQKEVPVRQLPILHAPVEDSCDEISEESFLKETGVQETGIEDVSIDELNETIGLTDKRPSPLCNSVKQGCRYFKVIYKFYHRETCILRLPFLVGTLVDDAYNTAYGNVVAVSYKGLDIQRAMLGVYPSWVNQSTDIAPQVRHILWATTIHIVCQVNEIIRLFPARHFFHFYRIHPFVWYFARYSIGVMPA